MTVGNYVKQTDEQTEIADNIEKTRELQQWQLHTFLAAFAFYLLWIVSMGMNYEGSPAPIIGVLLFIAHLILNSKFKRQRRHTTKLINAYTRKEAVPLYQEAREHFGDKYDVSLAEDGSIQLKKKQKEGNKS